MDAFKKMKNAKRRGIETVMDAVGRSEREVDTEYDGHKECFDLVIIVFFL